MNDSTPTEIGHIIRRPGQYQFGIVLLLLSITFVFMATGVTGTWVPLVTVVLQGATLLAALRASGVSRKLTLVARTIVAVGLISATTFWVSDASETGWPLLALSLLLVAGAPVAIGRSLIQRRVIDLRTVLGALCIYVLLGMLWAFGYATIGGLQDGPFFAQQATATLADFLYFSFVTLTTVGYGDLSALSGIGRASSVVEALIGQLYLVTVVALLVSNLGRNRVERQQLER